MRKHRHILNLLLVVLTTAAAVVVTAIGAASDGYAQHWQKVFQLPNTYGSCAFFFNANEGLIGTGTYKAGIKAQIYYTSDGGASWQLTNFPDPALLGQITDIYFKDHTSGWATVKEYIDHGWSGLYHSTDGGLNWSFVRPAFFPVAVRETKVGVFYTDRNNGVFYSTDQGKTFVGATSTFATLGLDFLNDQIGYASSEAIFLGPHLRTTNGGFAWTGVNTDQEAWSVYADPASNAIYYSSEINTQHRTGSALMKSVDNGQTFVNVTPQFGDSALNGSVTGWKGCSSAVYAQGWKYVSGFIRSTDNGNTWVNITGPSMVEDKRFGVTGRGAVVYAFDPLGEVWKTMDGGDGTLSPSVLPITQIKNLGPSVAVAEHCDSVVIPLEIKLLACDSIKISSVVFPDDARGELGMLEDIKKLRAYGDATPDTLHIVYKPNQEASYSLKVSLSLVQADGYAEDTTITLNFTGQPSGDRFAISTLTKPSNIDFGKQNICTGDTVREVTITNTGCSELHVSDFSITGAAFSLRSNFRPMVLDPQTSRTYLVKFKPSVVGPQLGVLRVKTLTQDDSITLTGAGIPGTRSLSIEQSSFTSMLCDSAETTIYLHNESCNAIQIGGVEAQAPFYFLGFGSPLNVGVDSSLAIKIRFKPQTAGVVTVPIKIFSNIAGNEFDTTLTVTGEGTGGTPTLSLSKQSINFDTVSQCSSADDSVMLIASGCGTVKITGASLDDANQGFSITNQPADSLNNQTDIIHIHYKPGSLGAQSTTLHVRTSIGDQTVTLTGIGTSGGGYVSLAISNTPPALLCTISTAQVSLTNHACGNVILDSVSFGGQNTENFSSNFSVPSTIPQGATQSFSFTYTPSVEGSSTTSVTCYLKYADGSERDTTFTVTTNAVRPSAVRFALPADSSLFAPSSSQVSIPLYLLDTTMVPASELEFTLALNTDLLTPLPSITSTGALSGATVDQFNIFNRDSVVIRLKLPAKHQLTPGVVAWIPFQSFVTDTLLTTIGLVRTALIGEPNTTLCLQTLNDQSSSVLDTFQLIPQCGEISISKKMQGLITELSVESIVPNPTQSRISIALNLASGYANDGVLQVFDELGHLMQSEPLVFSDYKPSRTIELNLTGSSGVRYIRIASPTCVVTRRVELTR